MAERSLAGPKPPTGRKKTLPVSPKTPGPQKARREPPAALLKGQIWKAKDTYVQIVDAGKTLIHYTMSPKPRQRGLRVHMATRETVQDFLKSNQARLQSDT